MRTLVITEHPEFGKVRTVEAGGRVWFCARDVASALGYANPKDAVNRHCRPKGVCVHDLLTAGGRQKVKFIDEGNLYRLMACSRLPSAERFESWIFDELVPRTLKEGGYLLGKEGETDAELLSRTLQLAEAKLRERDRYISGLEKENALNALKLSLQAPKVRYFDEVLHSPSTYTVTQIAKELGSVRSGLQDLKDAVQAGEAAQVQLRAMTGTLESAREWESWERGGLLSVVGRTAGLEEVQAQGGEIRQALSRLRTQLARVPQEKVPGADLEGFLAFADYFFEGVFSDLFSHAGLERAQGEVENILCEVDTLMESLREGLDALQAKEQALRQERETLLAGEERSMSHGTDTAAGDPSDLD